MGLSGLAASSTLDDILTQRVDEFLLIPTGFLDEASEHFLDRLRVKQLLGSPPCLRQDLFLGPARLEHCDSCVASLACRHCFMNPRLEDSIVFMIGLYHPNQSWIHLSLKIILYKHGTQVCQKCT